MGAALIGGGLGLLGSVIGGNSAKSAAQTSANAQLESARLAAEAQKFRPVGVTSRFGTSQFTTDPTTGYLTGAGYDVAPDIAALRDQLLSQAGGQGAGFGTQGLQQAQTLFNLGQQFLPTSSQYAASPEAQTYAEQLRGMAGQIMPTSYDPTAAAQQYVQQQQNLLQPGREQMQAGMTQNLFNTGRGGLAVAQGGNMGAANPEQQAYFNAIAQQNAQIAAQGSQLGRQQLAEDVRLGAGLGASALSTQQQAEDIARQRMMGNLQTGTGLFSSGLQLASGGYAPIQTQIGLASNLEQLGQNPMDIGAQLGGRAAQYGANVGKTLMEGGLGAAKTAQQANAYNPWATALTGLAGNQQLTSGISNWMTGGSPATQGYNQATQYAATSPTGWLDF